MFSRTLKLIVIAGACLAAEAKADALQDQLLAAARAVRPDAYSFRRTVVIDGTDSPRRVLVEQYDPRRPPGERWSLLSVDGRAPTAKEAAQTRKSNNKAPVPSYHGLADWIGSPATRIDNGNGYVTYRFARLNPGAIKVGSHDASPHTQAEAVVNIKGNTPFVERVRLTSNTKFRVMVVASVQSMNVSGRYALLANGIAVPVESASVMAGSMLGKSGTLKSAVTFSDFRAVK